MSCSSSPSSSPSTMTRRRRKLITAFQPFLLSPLFLSGRLLRYQSAHHLNYLRRRRLHPRRRDFLFATACRLGSLLNYSGPICELRADDDSSLTWVTKVVHEIDQTGRIVHFAEKPKGPTGRLC